MRRHRIVVAALAAAALATPWAANAAQPTQAPTPAPVSTQTPAPAPAATDQGPTGDVAVTPQDNCTVVRANPNPVATTAADGKRKNKWTYSNGQQAIGDVGQGPPDPLCVSNDPKLPLPGMVGTALTSNWTGEVGTGYVNNYTTVESTYTDPTIYGYSCPPPAGQHDLIYGWNGIGGVTPDGSGNKRLLQAGLLISSDPSVYAHGAWVVGLTADSSGNLLASTGLSYMLNSAGQKLVPPAGDQVYISTNYDSVNHTIQWYVTDVTTGDSRHTYALTSLHDTVSNSNIATAFWYDGTTAEGIIERASDHPISARIDHFENWAWSSLKLGLGNGPTQTWVNLPYNRYSLNRNNDPFGPLPTSDPFLAFGGWGVNWLACD